MKNAEVCNRVKEVLSGNKEVLAIFNNGSSVVDMDSEGSDVDFFVILKDSKGEKNVLDILRKNFAVQKNKESPEIVVEEQFEVLDKRADFTFMSKKEMEKKAENFYTSRDNFLKNQHFLQHKIVDAVTVYDPNRLLFKWKEHIKNYPKGFFEGIFDDSIRQVKENLFYWRHHQFRNEFHFAFEQWELYNPLIQALYARNKKLMMLPYKRLHRDLKILKPNLEKEFYCLIRGVNNKSFIKKKIKIIVEILKKLEK